MNPEDRVLVGVLKRKKDLRLAQEQGWYRIPEAQAGCGLYVEYIALFLSGSAAGKQAPGVYYYARRTGHELQTRAELLPDEADHPRAAEKYLKVQFRLLLEKSPPILNPSKRRFAFVHTTWDRFVKAHTIDDLYSHADHLVDRIYYALEDDGYRPQRSWEQVSPYPPTPPEIRILCENGEVSASTAHSGDHHGPHIHIDDDADASTARIKRAVADHGGLKSLPMPLEI